MQCHYNLNDFQIEISTITFINECLFVLQKNIRVTAAMQLKRNDVIRAKGRTSHSSVVTHPHNSDVLLQTKMTQLQPRQIRFNFKDDKHEQHPCVYVPGQQVTEELGQASLAYY